MNHLPEAFVLSHLAQRTAAAERNERHARLVAAMRAQRRAERAAEQAQRLLRQASTS